ncbi:hypothetical protein [Clostridium sp.]|uniref:hypothetical protein n=1 Tax=Clostridium sp. TaxID=1506 RepID=UPI00321731F7
MKFNVTLNNEEIDKIACITADKVLQTVKYQKGKEQWYERDIEELKLEVSKRDSMLVQKDLLIDRLRETLRKARNEIKGLKGD